ncbi:DUF421 domain-containing protein [Cytobacillus sp. FJAT-54145]|uniref:DUF421 domain-containing protein n=1 Tax=Cytobacillus spartinae TaxID=3299023 RepID=A0ABW6KFV2_9BACI
MVSFGEIALKVIVGFIALFLLTKILGRTQISQITPFDFISSLVLGELVGSAVFDKEVKVIQVLFALALWGILVLLIEYTTQKVKSTRGFFEGKPVMVIHEGKIIRENLRKHKLDINQLQQLLRGKGVFSIREVEFALLEMDGSVSVLNKFNYGQPERQDLQLTPKSVNLSVTLVNDGEIVYDNLRELGFDEKWLMNQLKSQGYTQTKDIFYAEWEKDEGMFIQGFNA